MRGLPIALLCLALAAALPVPGEAQDRPGVTTIMLPHNLARSQALANEAYRHDRAIAHINQNTRQLQLAHKRRLEDIDKDNRLDADARARRIADENQRFEIDMRALERQRAIAGQQHVQNEARIRADHPAPGDSEQFADRFDAEGSMLARAHAVANEDMRHERALAHVDENRRAREGTHRRRMKDIGDDTRLPADAKAMEREEENENFAVDLRHLERQRRIAEEDHVNQRAAIDARFGNPNPGADVFASDGNQTPSTKPGQAQPNDAPIEGGIGGAHQGGKAVTGPTGRPPRQGGTDQTGTGGAGQPVPGQPPVVLKGRVEETVGEPPPSQEAAQLPCVREFDASVPSGTTFTVGLSDGLARCVEGDVALLPVAPVAVLVSKYRLARVAVTAATRFQGAESLLRDLKKQRPADECAYDTGVWYAQVICDTQTLLPLPPAPKGHAGQPPHAEPPAPSAGTVHAPDPPPLTPERRARQAQQRQREAQTRGEQPQQNPPPDRTREQARAQDDAARAEQQRARQQEQRRQQGSAQAEQPRAQDRTPEQRAQDQRARAQQERQQQAAAQRGAQRQAEQAPGRPADPADAAIESGPVCGLKEDCFWRAMRNASGDPAFEGRFDTKRPNSWQDVYDTLKQYFGGKVPGVTSASHASGRPEKMSFDDIIDHLKDKEGAEGIVFVHYTNGESHALNVANFKRRVVFIDDQKQFWPGDAPYQTVEGALRGKVAYTKFYRTR